MKEDKLSRQNILLYALGVIPVVWLALLIAPAMAGGLPGLIENLAEIFSNPFHIEFCEDSVKTVLIFIFVYVMGIGIYISTARNYRRREEHGSAKWGNAKAVNKKYSSGSITENKILTQSTSKLSGDLSQDSMRLEATQAELHSARGHLKNAGLLLIGRTPKEAEQAKSDKGVLARLSRLSAKIGNGFASLEQKAMDAADKLRVSRVKDSVKTELQNLKSLQTTKRYLSLPVTDRDGEL